jgi:hypothetical protein
LASQLRFEGPVLEDLLDRVRTEVGTGARIVAANRIRKGGVGGFFSKEHYEVLVESGASSTASAGPAERALPAATPTARGGARVPMTILDLAEAVNDVERDHDTIDLVNDAGGDADDDPFAAMLDRITRDAGTTPPEPRFVIDADEPSVLRDDHVII